MRAFLQSKSEAKYLDLYENAPDMYASVNAKTALIEACNMTLVNTLEYSKKEIIGRPVFEIYHPDCLKEVKNAFQLFVETGKVHDIELQLRKKDGSKLDVSLNVSAVRGEDGQILFSRSTLRDITERKQAEEAYRISVSRFKDLFNKAAIPLCFVDKEGTMLNFNTQFEKTFGYSQQEIPTLNDWWQLAYPDPNYRKWVIDTCDAALQRAIEAKTDIEPIKYQVTIKNGDIRTMIVFGSFIGHDLLLTFFDITEHKQMEQERLAHLRFLENLDQVNRAIQANNDLEQMMSDVLDVVLSGFDCDRASLVYPCDPEAQSWTAPMERFRPPYEGVLALGLQVPMDDEVAFCHRLLRSSDGPVPFGQEHENPIMDDIREQFQIQSQLGMAIYPKDDKPWMFVIHQCSRSRFWQERDIRLFQEIGRRLEDALSSLLMNRNLKDSEERYRMVFENSPVSIWEEDFSAIRTFFNELRKKGIDDIETYFTQHPEIVRQCADMTMIVGVNRAALALHGAENKEELLEGLVNTFTPESFDTFRQVLVCLWNGGIKMTTDAVVKTITGERRSVTVCFSVCPGHDQTLSKVLVSLIDITERKRNQAINEARLHLMQFAAIHSLEELFEETLNEAEKLTGSLIGFYHFVEDDQKSLTLQNWSARTKAEFCKAEGKGLHYPISEAGVWVDCVHQRKPVIHNDYASLEHRKGMPEGHAEVIRELVVPVLRCNKIKAILGVGNKPVDYTEKDVEAISLLADLAWEIAERKQAEKALKKNEERYRELYERSPLGYQSLDADGCFVNVNQAWLDMLGYTREEVISKWCGNFLAPHQVELFRERFPLFKASGKVHNEFEMKHKDGSIIIVSVNGKIGYDEKGEFKQTHCILNDITERKEAEERERLATQVLELLNQSGEKVNVIHDILVVIRKFTGFDAVGIRLKNGDDFPYYETSGFPVEFIEAENYLCTCKPNGDLMRDSKSIPLLECMCGKVIRGRTDPSLPFFTKGGSFWTNSMTELLYSTDGKQRQSHIRNRCNSMGYESVALIPLYADRETIGLLQLNDRRKDMFNLEKMRFFEEIGASIGISFKRKNAEEALKISEQHYRAIVEDQTELICRFLRDSTITFANEAYCRYFDRTRDELTGWKFMPLIPEEDHEKVNEHFTSLGHDKPVDTHEHRVIMPNGEIRWHQWTNRAIFDDVGNIVEYQGAGRDITKQKLAEEELRENEKRFRSLSEAAFEGIGITENGLIIDVNDAVLRMYGYSYEELKGKQVIETVAPEHRELVLEKIRSGYDGLYELKGLRKDGSLIDLEVQGRNIEYQGQTMRLTAIRDITEHKQAERGIQEYLAQLKSLASELSLAEERERRRIATGIHDDIAQKLAMAKFSLQTLQASIKDADVSISLEKQCELMSQVVTDARSLTFELGNPVLYQVGLEAAVESYLTERIQKEFGIKCEFKSEGPKSSLKEDVRIVLFQAVRELLANVIKHANASTVKVSVKSTENSLQIVVEDDGVGFDPTKIGPQAIGRGGFGLFNIRERLEYFGGNFEIESRPKSGTRVTMTVALRADVITE